MNHALATTGAEGVEIFMSALSVTARPQRGTLGDLAAMWVALVGALAYLDVPLRNAPLFATALVLQAALGTIVITRLLDGLQPSLLLLCGPGLILGGALSFLVFQVGGRGAIGIGFFLACGVLACARLLRTSVARESGMHPALLSMQLCGIAALALSSEFEWLLIVAGGCLAASLAWVVFASRSPVAVSVAAVSFLGSFGVATALRGPLWWIVSDDYMLFEVIARHLTAAGPFAPWGVIDFSQYHWLSYGWSGLLDFAASSPDTLVTLTRVIPLVYSLTLASSLLIIVEQVVRPSAITPISVLPAWVVMASVRLDWSAPSTAGIFAVIAATVAIATIVVDRDDTLFRRACLYALFALISVLTKLPGSLVLLPLVLAAETTRLMKEPSDTWKRVGTTLAVLVGCILAMTSLPFMFNQLGSFSLEAKHLPGVKWFYGPHVALLIVIVRVLPLTLWATVTWVIVSNYEVNVRNRGAWVFMTALSAFLIMGIATESLVNGPQNTQEYFSVPNYFLALLSTVSIAPFLSRPKVLGVPRGKSVLWIGLLATVLMWKVFSPRVVVPYRLERFADFFYSADDSQLVANTLTNPVLIFGAALVSAIWLRRKVSDKSITLPLVLLLLLTVLLGLQSTAGRLANEDRRLTSKRAEFDLIFGAKDARSVGVWLRETSSRGDKVATNYLIDLSTNEFSDDYSLAMWSQRMFLVIGPKFFYASDSAKSEVDVSLRFGAEPDAASASQLLELGVDWFVVDREATSVRSWEPWAELRFESGRFAVLRLKTSATS